MTPKACPDCGVTLIRGAVVWLPDHGGVERCRPNQPDACCLDCAEDRARANPDRSVRDR